MRKFLIVRSFLLANSQLQEPVFRRSLIRSLRFVLLQDTWRRCIFHFRLIGILSIRLVKNKAPQYSFYLERRAFAKIGALISFGYLLLAQVDP